ncbi:LysR family transcriptional regulator [Marinomonas algicola]|uniref:LysR family transcriptional regulator n=1 Tax=Marinomonas algicola TaxID=2773454 RepID=UPI00174CA6AF|nr:LysR family transcriptional regulator [Marinomonas algicola]
MISPVLLRSFCTLVENGHFTRTAEKLHMTQSGVSQHIKKLEGLIGTDLLDRDGKSFELTEAGRNLYKEAKKIVNALTDLETNVKSDPAYEGTVRIMSPGSIGLKLYPNLLKLQACYPKLIIDYRFGPNVDIEQALLDKRIDCGLLTSVPTESGLSCRPIGQESLLLVMPAIVNDDANTQRQPPDWRTLERLGFIDHPDGTHHATVLLSANYQEFKHIREFEKKGFSNQIHLILKPVSLGLGFTVLPRYAVESFPHSNLISAQPLVNPVTETLYIATQSANRIPQRVNTVMDVIKSCLEEHL